jgi:hypothetical protein
LTLWSRKKRCYEWNDRRYSQTAKSKHIMGFLHEYVQRLPNSENNGVDVVHQYGIRRILYPGYRQCGNEYPEYHFINSKILSIRNQCYKIRKDSHQLHRYNRVSTRSLISKGQLHGIESFGRDRSRRQYYGLNPVKRFYYSIVSILINIFIFIFTIYLLFINIYFFFLPYSVKLYLVCLCYVY